MGMSYRAYSPGGEDDKSDHVVDASNMIVLNKQKGNKMTEEQAKYEVQETVIKPVKVGDDVLYVLEDGTSKGQSRPAKVVRVWGSGRDTTQMVQLQVFTDGTNDGTQYASGIAWKTSVHHDPERSLRSWHWPEEA